MPMEAAGTCALAERGELVVDLAPGAALDLGAAGQSSYQCATVRDSHGYTLVSR